MASAWSNPGPAKQVIITGTNGELLVYAGVPAAGNLILAISGQAGSDAFGNTWSAGLNLAGQAIITGQELVYSAAPALGNLLLAIAGLAGSDSFGNLWESGVTIEDNSGGLLVYNGQEALDGLIVSVTAAAGTDQVGNSWKPGLNILAPTGVPTAAIYFRQNGNDPINQNAQISFDALPGINHTLNIINQAAGAPVEETFIDIVAQNSAGNAPHGSSIVLDSFNGLGFAASPVGGSFYNRWSYAKTVPSQLNPRTFVTGPLTLQQGWSNYSGTVSAGQITIPAQGIYNVEVRASGTPTVQCDIELSTDGGATWGVLAGNEAPTGRSLATSFILYDFNIGDMLRFGLSQTSGGSLSITGEMIIHKSLG
jgi:hypothetical protein